MELSSSSSKLSEQHKEEGMELLQLQVTHLCEVSVYPFLSKTHKHTAWHGGRPPSTTTSPIRTRVFSAGSSSSPETSNTAHNHSTYLTHVLSEIGHCVLRLTFLNVFLWVIFDDTHSSAFWSKDKQTNPWSPHGQHIWNVMCKSSLWILITVELRTPLSVLLRAFSKFGYGSDEIRTTTQCRQCRNRPKSPLMAALCHKVYTDPTRTPFFF